MKDIKCDENIDEKVRHIDISYIVNRWMGGWSDVMLATYGFLTSIDGVSVSTIEWRVRPL